MLDKTQIIVRTTHGCGPSLARAIDRSRQLLAFLLVLAPLCPSGRTQPAPCGSWPPSKTGDRPRRGDSMSQSRNRQTHGKRSTMGRRADVSLAREMAPLRGAGRRNLRPQAPRIHLPPISRFLRRGALRVMLDKAGGDMVHLGLILATEKKTEPPG
jgi:hypothetical protein